MAQQILHDVYISLGPACFTASLLKFADFRRYSLPFDWARTGSFHWEDSFNLTPDEFYTHNVLTPNHRMVQVGDPRTSEIQMSELAYKVPTFGYPYFFNPHKKIGHDKDYIIRCLKRLKQIYQSSDVLIKFVLSKHKDKVEEDFYFNLTDDLLSYFQRVLSSSGLNAVIHLIEVGSSRDTFPTMVSNKLSEFVIHYEALVNEHLYYGSDEIRQNIVGKLYKSHQNRSNILDISCIN